ncbi:Ig-like domain-containing protein, partial [Streptomyces alfalfae]|uniref:Ig-like domain-containing protein n=1 Tax=Streptomyces alfalfae TaxID=1642299 RepID=UPI0028113DB2
MRTLAAVAGLVVLAGALTACSGSGQDPEISVNLTGRDAKAGGPVKVTLAEGKLERVAVTDGKGEQMPGRVAEDGSTWISGRRAAPGTTYRVRAV